MADDERKLVLCERKEVADGTTTFWFTPLVDSAGFETTSDFSFRAGQWVDITLLDPKYRDDGGTTRTFSIASSPHYIGKFMVVMRNGKSAFKRSLRELAIGAEVKLTGIGGSFVLPEEIKHSIVMIAGGIGIAPMRAMIEWATHKKTEHKITLLYSNRTAGEAAFLDELRTHFKTPPDRVRSDFFDPARRAEEAVAPALQQREATPRGEEIARALRDAANSGDSFVAPPRSITEDTPSSSLRGLAGIDSHRGGRGFEMGSRWETENQNFKLIATLTEGYDPSWKGERGRIDEAMLKRHIPDVSNVRYYIAGPPAMVAATWQMLVGMGVDDGAIKTEEFSGY